MASIRLNMEGIGEQPYLGSSQMVQPYLGPVPNLPVFPLGIVPKKAPGEFRCINHLSYPKGRSVIDAVDPSLCSVRYASCDSAIAMVARLG